MLTLPLVSVLQKAKNSSINWQLSADMSNKELSKRLFPTENSKPAYKMPIRELNEAIKEKLHIFNNKPFQKKAGSRSILFAEEKPFLLPLPIRQFELATWKIATVQYNYHVSADIQNYSVPYEYIKQKS